MLLLLWNVDIFVFPAALIPLLIPLLVVGYFCHGIANPLHFTKSYMHHQSSVTVTPTIQWILNLSCVLLQYVPMEPSGYSGSMIPLARALSKTSHSTNVNNSIQKSMGSTMEL